MDSTQPLEAETFKPETLKRDLALYMMLLPYLLGLAGLVFIPALLSLGLAFTRYDALSPPVWSGWANLERMLGDRLFWIVLGNTAFYLAVAVPLRLVGALGLALLFRSRPHGLAQAIVCLPTIIPDVAYAMIWLVALNPRFGPVNLLLNAVGLPGPAWLAEPWPARLALAGMAAWQLGEGFVILLASLGEFPPHLDEAAALDGAGDWARFRHVVLPLLLPRLFLLTARDLIVGLQASFTPSLILTRGGPGYTTLFVPLYSYILAFDDFQLGYASALVWVVYALTALGMGALFFVGRRWQHTGAFSE
ncbi:MAG: sugar ABC transporter permease [Thermoflexales bacterium]|nr:sugar ABC transporter permease [Thermoflexales bacterium]